MNKTGITRKVDNLGRVVIPKTYRDKLQIKENDTININIEDQILIMTKVEDSCLFCGSKKDLITFENKLICNKCCNKFLSKILIKWGEKNEKNKEYDFALEQYKKLRKEQGFKDLTEKEEIEYLKGLKKLEEWERLFDKK